MREGDSGVVLTPGPNLLYLTGLADQPSERLLALLLPTAGEPVLVAPLFERERLAAEVGIPVEIVTWSESEDPFRMAAPRTPGSRWLLDPWASFWVAARFEDAGVRFRSAGSLCSALRRSKEPQEVELLARAQRLTRDTLASLPHLLSPGITEREVAEEIQRSFRKAGAEGWALVQFAAGSALPHGEAGARQLVHECAVLVDLGAVVEGYHADLTRSWWFGERPNAQYGRVASAVEQAQAAAAALARPGTPAQELDRGARRYLESRELGQYFVHRLGHGVGLEIHEEPFLVEGNAALLQVGDVFTIEPGVYVPGEFGVRHEDVWMVGREAAVRL